MLPLTVNSRFAILSLGTRSGLVGLLIQLKTLIPVPVFLGGGGWISFLSLSYEARDYHPLGWTPPFWAPLNPLCLDDLHMLINHL